MYKHGASIKENAAECEEEGGKGDEEHEECEEAACGAEEEGDKAGSVKGKHVLCVCLCVESDFGSSDCNRGNNSKNGAKLRERNVGFM